MHGQPETSRIPRYLAIGGHVLAVGLAAAWLARDGELAPRDLAVLGASAIYLLRTAFGTLVLLKRRFDPSEAAIVTGLFMVFHLGFAWLADRSHASLGLTAAVGAVLYLLGSFLNTGAEVGRHRFKLNPAHRGQLYTGGLFRLSMHVNYFGDSVLFTGFALLTGSPWALLVPAAMTAGFVFHHVPALDAYLAERYGAQFEA